MGKMKDLYTLGVTDLEAYGNIVKEAMAIKLLEDTSSGDITLKQTEEPEED
jgi:hypothetical protein